ncbi:MAG: PAS domain S-box protein [Desulfatiglans sp.]|nr:PAS domain S-box protein [Desulfatiglans sp.]
MNIRYNNAMLIQEIGQATSSIMGIHELPKTVLQLMEKRLDFDRGMIMLANREKTRLLFSGGYGYVREQEDILRETEFHLDRPQSKGVFVVAFRDQKPFLVNDIMNNAKNLSERSLEFAKQLEAHSFICVPIVYEKETLGILAVDNVTTKRPLTQSDLSLLLGVASQTALNMVQTTSFQKLQESEEKYRDLVENANSIILRRDTDGIITFINEFAQKFFGYPEDEIIGKNIKGTILPDTEATVEYLKGLMKELERNPAEQLVLERENRRRNGESVWIAWTFRPIFDSSGHLSEILSIGNDVTELKRAEQEKKDLEAQLVGAQKMEAVGTLAGGIAHDFNNILQAIFGYTQILMLGKDENHPDYKKLAAIENSAQKASELTKRLLIFSRKVESQLRPVDLNHDVLQVSTMLERTIPKMIEIRLDLAEDLSIVKADSVQLEQIMMNLGVNARDAMPTGGRLSFETRNVYLDDHFCSLNVGSIPGEYVLLSVSDTGQGMEKEVEEHIFEPFFTTKELGKGTGLGLAMVYGIVKNHGGYIACDSEPGRGTTFNIYLPVVEEEASREERSKIELPIGRGEESILLVDDEESIVEVGRELLESYGYAVMTASDGESALEVYSKKYNQIDLVILDLSMPVMGGQQCLEGILKIEPEAKVIIASGYAVAGNTRDSFEHSAKGFISKPYNVSEILKTVREVLDS